VLQHLQVEERQILELKYAAPKIKTFTDDLLRTHTQLMLFKIHVITGWKLPEMVDSSNPDAYALNAKANILEEQFYLKLKEDYGEMNVEEVAYAIRKFGTQVKDWGKDINLSLIDTVLIKYLETRVELSDLEMRLKKEAEKPKPTDEQILSIKRETIEVCYQGFLNGKQSIALIPHDAIATLALDEHCDFTLYENFRTHALHYVQKHLSNEIEDYKLRRKAAMVESTQKELAALSVGDEIVERTAKKMALVYFFSEAQKAGLKNIYTKVEE
jgi:hypothetical protein